MNDRNLLPLPDQRERYNCPMCGLNVPPIHTCPKEVEFLRARVSGMEEANGSLEGGKIDAEAERDCYRETIQSFLSTVLTVKRENQPEWMEYLAERINEVCEVIGEEDRVAYNPRQEAILPIK